MQTATIIVRLWDFGWILHDAFNLRAQTSDVALIEEYMASAAFNTSFVPNEGDETGIHGPFNAESLKPTDFQVLEESELPLYLESIQIATNPHDDIAERQKILECLGEPFRKGFKCFLLIQDERNDELFHEWGFVFRLFREFVFIIPQSRQVERFVIGYD